MSSHNEFPRTDGPVLVTLGCRLNAAESEIMRRLAIEAGFSDTIIVNSCTVTAEADRQTRQAIRKARRKNPNARLIVTGCAVQADAGRFIAMDEVDLVLGQAEKLDPAYWRADLPNGVYVQTRATALTNAPRAHLRNFGNRTRAFLEIQTGCDHACAYCIIPSVRGPSRSVAPEDVIARARDLVEAGHPEIVLTGVDIASYAPLGLGALCGRILTEVPELRRLRLSSLDPACVDPDLLLLMAKNERLMPHLHLSVQSGDDMILRRMRRRHTRGQVIDLVRAVRALRPDVTLGTDLIAGFPTETEDMFENTRSLIDEADITFVHVFPYSPRPGTPAANMPAVSAVICKKRALLLREAGIVRREALLDRSLGERAHVLTETGDMGHTAHFIPMRLDKHVSAGTLVAATVTGHKDGILMGECL